MTIAKPVTPIEKFYVALDQLYTPFVNQLVVLGRGTLDAADVESALRRAAEANPGVTLRHQGVLGRMRWVPGPAPRFAVHDGRAWDARGGADAPFLAMALDAREGPSCELQLVERDDGPALVFRSLHATMDGGGTRHWAEEVFRALRGEPLLGSDDYRTDKEFAAGLTDRPFRLPPEDALSPLGTWDRAAPETRRWVRATIERPVERDVLARIALALAARARRAGADAGLEGVVRVNIPADLRFFRPDARSTGNLIGTIIEEVAPDDTVEAFAERVKQRLRDREHARFPVTYDLLRWMSLWRMRSLVRKAVERARATNRQAFSATVSFLGAFPPEPLSTPTFSPDAAFFVPPVAQQGCFITGTTMRGVLELLVAMPEALASGGRGDALVAELRAALTA